MGDRPERPIILLGCPRSGTTLLQLMLHSHPRIAVAPETRYLLAGYRGRLQFGDLRAPANRLALARFIVDRRGSRFGDLGLDAELVRAEIVAGPPTLGSAFAIVLRAYAARFDKPRWGDKRPKYYQDVAVLHRLFPDAQFVHLVRDGRDCVASLKRMDWYREGTLAAMATWIEAVDYGRRAARRLGPDRWHELRYERLVADPEPELRRLCAFLGEEYADAMAQPGRTARVAVPKRKTWHARTRGAVDVSRVGRWREGLEPEERALLEYVAGGRLRSYGYQVDAPVRRPPAALLARFGWTAAHRRLAHRKTHLQDLVRDARAGQPVAAQPPR